jgi:hypothetical protein
MTEKKQKEPILKVNVKLLFPEGTKLLGSNGVTGRVNLERVVVTPIRGTNMELIEQEYRVRPIVPGEKFEI